MLKHGSNRCKGNRSAESSPDIFALRLLSPQFIEALVVILAITVATVVVWRSEKNRLQLERAHVSAVTGEHAYAIQANFERALSATYSLAAMVRQGKGVVRDFKTTALEMLPFYPGVSSLQLAPGGVLRDIVPLAGNEKAIGHNLFKDPARMKEALLAEKSGKLTLAGPYKLIQGGIGAIGRLPVFLDDSTGHASFWGFTSALIRFPAVLAPAHLSNLEKLGYRYELWRIAPDTGKKQIIAASSSAALVKPVEHPVEVPNEKWILSVAPADGWGNPGRLAFKVLLGLIFCLMFLVLTRSLLNIRAAALKMAKNLTVELETLNEQLEQRILERTSELCQKNTELQQLLEEIKILKGILPICSYCKKIRDDSGGWNQIEAYIQEHSNIDFSHGICPDCMKQQFAEFV